MKISMQRKNAELQKNKKGSADKPKKSKQAVTNILNKATGKKLSVILFGYSILVVILWLFNLYVYDIPNTLVKVGVILLTLLAIFVYLVILFKHKINKKIKVLPTLINVSIGIMFIYFVRNLYLLFNGYNLIDVSTYANFPLILYVVLPLLVAIFSIIILNIGSDVKKDTIILFKRDFPKFLQNFVLFSIVLNVIFISILVLLKKTIINNGGLLFYILKSALLGFGQKFSVQAVLSMTLGNTAISMLVFMFLVVYWLKIVLEFKGSKLIKIFGVVLSIVWTILSLFLALSSYNLFLLWVLGAFAIGFIMYRQYFLDKKIISKIFFWVLGIFILALFIFTGFWVANQPIKNGLNNLLNVFLNQLKGVIEWGKFLINAKNIGQLLSIRLPILITILLGYVYGSTSNILSLSTAIGVKLSSSYIFHFLTGFGVVGLLFISYAIYLAIKYFLSVYDELAFLLLMITVSIFFVPFSAFYSIVYVLVFSLLIYLSNMNKIQVVSVTLHKIIYDGLYWFIALILVILYFNVVLFKTIHYTNAYEVKALSSLNQILVDYKKATQNKDKNKIQLNSKHITNFQLNFSKYLYWQKKLVDISLNSKQPKLTNLRVVQNLYSVGMQYPKLYNLLVNAPNLEAKNQYISLVYELQKTAWMPYEYKLLGNAWYGLSLTEKTPLFAVRASRDYERALAFYPLDNSILQNYVSILLKDYQSALKNNANNEVKASLEQKIKGVLSLLQESGIIKLKTNKNLDVLLNAVILEAQYYKLSGNIKKAQATFDSLKTLIKNLKMTSKNKDTILKFIDQVENRIIAPIAKDGLKTNLTSNQNKLSIINNKEK